MAEKSERHDAVRNVISGGSEVALQAGGVHGDVNIRVGRRVPAVQSPRQLPSAIRPFINRMDSIERLDGYLTESSDDDAAPMVISAIAGEAGIGKTALAVYWAHRVRESFPDGDLYINLRGYDRMPRLPPEQALDTFLRSLGVPPARIPAGLDARAALYRSLVAGKRILVVLDNAATSEQVRPLLPGSKTSVVLITSRSRLSGLVIRDGVNRMVLDVLSPEESVHLLRGIIGVDKVDAEPREALILAEQCSYLPLALRIVAERAVLRRHLRLSDLTSELSAERDRLDALTIDEDELVEVRTVFSWSYRALPADAARMFRLLGLHAGPDIGLDAAAVVAGASVVQARRLLDSLAGLHLIQESRPDRYRSHDLLRAYAVERVEAEEPEEVRASIIRRLLLWYLGTAYSAYRAILPQGRPIPMEMRDDWPAPLSFTDLDMALRWCDRERVNLLDALRQADECGYSDIVWKMSVALMAFFERFSYWNDWISSHQAGVRAARRLGDKTAEAWVLILLGDAYWDMGNHPDALVHYRKALEVSRAAGDKWGEAFSLRGSGLVSQSLGDYSQAIEFSCAALPIVREIGDRRGEGMTLLSIANGYRGLLQHENAQRYYGAALTIFEELGNHWSEALCVHQMGLIEAVTGDQREAVRAFQRASGTFRELGDRRHAAVVLMDLGQAYRRVGDGLAAGRAWREGLALFDELKDPQADTVRQLLRELDQATQGDVRPPPAGPG